MHWSELRVLVVSIEVPNEVVHQIYGQSGVQVSDGSPPALAKALPNPDDSHKERNGRTEVQDP